MINDLIYSDATKLAELVRTKDVSPVEIMRAHLDRIEAVNGDVNAIVTVADGALEAARRAEAAVLSGGELGPLHGVPFTAKDSIDTAGVMTQRGSPIFKGRLPIEDATSVARLKTAGGILLAKTNLPEFSYWIESDNLLSGRSNNPWNLERTPGGSSGGESAAIAAGMSPIGLGTDLAISVRGPAAQTGITSMKATHGRVADDRHLATCTAPLLACRPDGPLSPRYRACLFATGRTRRQGCIFQQHDDVRCRHWSPAFPPIARRFGWLARALGRSIRRSQPPSRQPPRR